MPEALDIDGKSLALRVREELAAKIKDLEVRPVLAVILAGDNAASQIYVRNKQKAAEKIGMKCDVYFLNADVAEQELFSLIDGLNKNPAVNGILVQLPLPPHLDTFSVLERISPNKDVDGFSLHNLGALMKGREDGIIAATPKAVLELLFEVKRMSGVKAGEEYDFSGKNAVIIGRSQIVGRPLSALLLNHNCTVTVAHSKTKNLQEICSQADILVAACGCPEMVKADWVKEGAVVIDVGINRIDGRLCGDVAYSEVKHKASYLTPVPGGVGPMTIAMLLANTYQVFLEQNGLKK